MPLWPQIARIRGDNLADNLHSTSQNVKTVLKKGPPLTECMGSTTTPVSVRATPSRTSLAWRTAECAKGQFVDPTKCDGTGTSDDQPCTASGKASRDSTMAPRR